MTTRSRTPEYSRAYDALRRNYNFTALRDGTVTRRKLAALQAIGYTLTDVANRLDRRQQSMSETFLHDSPIHWKTERAVAVLYDELHDTPAVGWYATRCRLRAQRLGYAAPAAWDSIDDLHERPKGVLKT